MHYKEETVLHVSNNHEVLAETIFCHPGICISKPSDYHMATLNRVWHFILSAAGGLNLIKCMMWNVQTPCTMVGMTYSESVIATLIDLKSIQITSNTENKLQL